MDVNAGHANAEGGYTMAVHMIFADQADMDYYDNECPAHGKLKERAKPLMAGPPFRVLYDNVVNVSRARNTPPPLPRRDHRAASEI